jgi:serine protease Do
MSLKRSGFVAGAAVGIGLTAAVAVGAGIQLQRASAQGAIQPIAPPGAMAPTGSPMSFANIIERVAPAVVSIEVTTHLPPQRAMQIPGLPFPFNAPGQGNGDDQGGDGDDNGDQSDQGQGPMQGGPGQGGNSGGAGRHAPHRNTGPRAMAAGSGFFISDDGYIVTNNHVIENAESIKVTLTDQRELTAHLVGRDPLTDLAVLKVDGTHFPYVNFESQAKPRVGDWVIAIGNPYTLGGTVTAGIVSSERRTIPGENQVVPYLQIDAPINRGNSGGPTFDVFGRVIGVNTAIFSESGGSVGIGFAIPADLANTITHELIAHGHVTHGYLGVLIQNVTADIAASEGIQPNHGALVGDVTAGGPGAAAGIQTGDIIQSVNGTPVNSAADLSQVTAMTLPGEALHIKLLRNGHVVDLTAKAGTRPSNEQLAENENGAEGPGGKGSAGSAANTRVLGMGLASLTDALRQQYGLGAAVRGVVVTHVAQDSEAAEDGLRPGIVIVRAGDHAALTPADVVAAVSDARRDHRPSVLLFLNVGGKPAAVPLKLDSGDAANQR